MQAGDVDIDLLRAFIAVAETGSFTAAAEVIARSQSAVSQKIIRLEKVLGMRVFERTSRALTLTSEGERLLVGARKMMVHFDNFVREIREPEGVNVLRLGISENLVPTQLPRLLSHFSKLYPDIQLELTTGLSNDLLADHEAGLLDVVIAKRKISATTQRLVHGLFACQAQGYYEEGIAQMCQSLAALRINGAWQPGGVW